MTLTLYNSPGERNLLNRNMAVVGTQKVLSVTDPCRIETPEILLDYDATFINADYAYIDNFSRYYFITDKEIVNGNHIRLFLESDPLMSFKASILSSPCIAKRTSMKTFANGNIVDDRVTFSKTLIRDPRKAATGFTPNGSGNCYCLTLGGK